MPLSAGTKLGPYEIQAPLGAGGMGEVYRARDTRLDRVVAVKILASHLASTPELKQRMEREARSISSLNHPHICHLYDIGSQGGTDFLVMEFLEGETLAERLRKGALPLHELLKIGIAVAEALAVAHKHGIVHRDLKPGNIMLTQGGAKLMDFGLAKSLGLQANPAPSGAVPAFTAAPTISGASPFSPLTTAGSIVGTIQYMSPEQIEGKEADARSDIFAFGAVLYEMAAGKKPFEGKSQISLASSILEKDPEPITAIKPLTPLPLEHVIRTCLEKNPDDRYQSAQDVKLQLQWIGATPAAPVSAPAAPQVSTNIRGRLGWVAAVVLAILLGAVSAILLNRPSPMQTIRTAIDPPEKTTFNLTGDDAGPPVLSPDGGKLAFSATSSDGKTLLWVRPMNSVEAHALAGTEGVSFPFWSPDGRSLGFFASGKLKTVEVESGSVQVVCDAQVGRGGTWGPDGVILFSPTPSAPMVRVSASGGNPVPITKLDLAQHTSHRWPFFLPDGKHYLFLAMHHDPSKAANNTIYYGSLDGKQNQPLFHSQSNAIYANGFLLFAREDQLLAQPFDPANGKLSGEPHSVARGVMNDVSTWHMDTSVSNDGLMVFGSGGNSEVQLVWVDRSGKDIGTVADKLSDLQGARISPQGDRVALQINAGVNDLWVLDLARGVRTRLTFGPVANIGPVWSPDGKWIGYACLGGSYQFSLCRKPSDGSGAEEKLFTDDHQILPTDWSPDGKELIFERAIEAPKAQIWILPLEGEHTPRILLERGANGKVSPDGHWLVYDSVISGQMEVYVVPFSGGQGKWQVSVAGGMYPEWSKDGREIYYMDPAGSLLAVPVKEISGALQFGSSQTLVSKWTIINQPLYDVAPTGKKILLDRVAQQVTQPLTVVTNWMAELKR